MLRLSATKTSDSEKCKKMPNPLTCNIHNPKLWNTGFKLVSGFFFKKNKNKNAMDKFAKLITDFKTSQEAFKVGIENISSDFQERQKEEIGSVSLDNGFLDRQPSDFGLHYCLTETMHQLERCIKEKPSRELSLAKTKLQEACFWVSQS